MVRDPMRPHLALALSVAALACAGCMRGAYSLREAPGYVPPSVGEGFGTSFGTGLGTGSSEPLDMFRGAHGTIGVEMGKCSLRGDGWSDEFDEGAYYGARYSRMLGLNWGLSVAAGHFSAPAGQPGEDNLEFYLARCTLEFGSYIGTSLSRWYLGAGGGYTIFDDERDLSGLGLGTIDDEWTTHAALGVEFRNESIFATRLEAGHAWLGDSEADHWTGSVTIALQF